MRCRPAEPNEPVPDDAIVLAPGQSIAYGWDPGPVLMVVYPDGTRTLKHDPG